MLRDELIQMAYSITKMNDEAKRAIGISALSNLKEGLEDGGIDPGDIPGCIRMFTKLLVSADRACNEKEYVYFKEVTGIKLTYDEFFEMTNCGTDEEFIDEAFELIDILDRHDRIALVSYAAALLSYDNSFKVGEFKLLDRIMSGGDQNEQPDDEEEDEDDED